MHNKAKTYTVYVHENSTNGKVYIGITSQNPKIVGETEKVI